MAKPKEGKAVPGRKASRPGMPTSARTRSIAPPTPKDDEPPEDRREEQMAEQIANPPVEPTQAPLIPDADIPVVEAKPIVNDRMAATYVGLALSRDKGKALCSLEFSLQLTDHHREYVPEKAATAYSWLLLTDNKESKLNHVPSQTVDVFEEPRAKKPMLHIVGATVEKGIVTMIEESGKGKSKQGIRFVFRLKVERDEKTIDFATKNDEREFWIEMKQTQATIG